MVENQHFSIVRAAKRLELKLCTARSILNKFKKKGIIYDKKLKKHVKPAKI
jgi:transposase